MSIARLALVLALVSVVRPAPAAGADGPPAGSRHRVVVSTDIGGTDFDDFQSLVHLLLYADSLDLEGLVSSPYGPGRQADILRVIERYERDYHSLRRYSDHYPTPDALRAITKQGAVDVAGRAGYSSPTEGSDWIVTCARRADPRPLHVLVWGGIEDLAQALHDAPDILPRLRVYFIGGPNKKWSVDAYHYIATHHPTLWIIEANETYRGWFIGGNQDGDLGNDSFVAAHVAGHGALGEFFARGITFEMKTRSTLKMGDSPSVGWLLHGTPDDPAQPGWGGQFVRAWERPYRVFERLTTASDTIEQFGVFELALLLGDGAPGQPTARLQIENQLLPGTVDAQGVMRFRFSPKEAKEYRYTILANTPTLDGIAGALTSLRPSPDAARRPSPRLPNWWTDDPATAAAEGPNIGARTVSRWREAFLRDFAARLLRCNTPAANETTTSARAQAAPAPPGAQGARSGAPLRWGIAVLQQEAEWYGSAEAHAVADSVLQYQSAEGGWPKNTDLAAHPRSPEDIPSPAGELGNSLDNTATTLPMQFLALVTHATGEARYRDAFMRGMDYLLAAQYPNGGWPQFYPLREGYYSHITYNDDAMVRVLTVLRDAAAGKPPYEFVDAGRRAKSAAAVTRGIDCILRTQILQQGTLTAWCAQHDEKTLAPAWARAYEPPSLSGSESVGIVRFLMEIDQPSPAIVAAIEGAVAWFRAVAIRGLRVEGITDAEGKRDRRVVADPAAPLMWARFYELNTNRPIFLGRNSIVRYVYGEVELERRLGYNYYGTWPATLLSEDYPDWRKKHGLPQAAIGAPAMTTP